MRFNLVLILRILELFRWMKWDHIHITLYITKAKNYRIMTKSSATRQEVTVLTFFRSILKSRQWLSLLLKLQILMKVSQYMCVIKTKLLIVYINPDIYIFAYHKTNYNFTTTLTTCHRLQFYFWFSQIIQMTLLNLRLINRLKISILVAHKLTPKWT